MSFKYDEVLCPECNGQMISRKGKFGIFWGCKRYPDCKGTRDNQGRSRADRAKEKDEEYEDKEETLNHSVEKFSFKKT